MEIGEYADHDEPAPQRLSEQRSLSVFRYLVAKGVPAARLARRGYGSSVPVVAPNMPDRRANMRVQFLFGPDRQDLP
ncbi:MAG: OmpA family protein [Polyangiaceae bacterium]|nr:OmpA family protein [Polyangiaceae bacterium]